MADFTTRPIVLDDVKAVASLIQELGYVITSDELETQIQTYLTSEQSLAVVATTGQGSPVGLVTGHLIPLIHEAGSLGRITALVVSTTARGSGVGSDLLHCVEDWFQERGCLRAGVTSGDYRRADHQFYERHGFSQDERRFLKRYAI